MSFRKLPSGVQDILPRECRVLQGVQKKLAEMFERGGFEPVRSASLEYYDAYSKIKNAVAEERMFKSTDTDGKLLVLRPDATLAIARIAATKLTSPSARLYYFADKWDLQSAGGISGREIYQAGVECLGEEGAFADAQTIAFAIECLQATGVKDFIVDVGHTGYFKGVLQSCGLCEEEEEQVRAYINAKDGLNAEKLLRRAGANANEINTVLALPTLFGGAEVLEEAERLTSNQTAREAIARLKQVYDLLCKMGYEHFICFDLGTVKRLSYYTGIVFTALVKELGSPVLSGGRYDNLADDFGKHIPAVGFAMGLKRVLIALERQGGLPKEERLDVAVVCENGAEKEGYLVAQGLRHEGKRVRLFASHGEDGVALAKEIAQKTLFVTQEGVEEV